MRLGRSAGDVRSVRPKCLTEAKTTSGNFTVEVDYRRVFTWRREMYSNLSISLRCANFCSHLLHASDAL